MDLLLLLLLLLPWRNNLQIAQNWFYTVAKRIHNSDNNWMLNESFSAAAAAAVAAARLQSDSPDSSLCQNHKEPKNKNKKQK